MGGASNTAQRWTCDRCGMTTSRIDGDHSPLPESWVSGADGRFCLACRRERAAEAAQEAAPSDCDSSTRARLRRAGMIEFEVLRVPEHADNVIAKACHSSASVVAAARQRLDSPAGRR